MFFIDTHCHLNFKTYQQNINSIVDRALENGVNYIVVPGIDLLTSEKAVELTTKFECVYAAVGVHPNELNNYNPQQFSSFEKLIKENKTVAVGEIGLDFYRYPDTVPNQIIILESMLDLAFSYNKPVILHSRQSLEKLLIEITKWQSSHDQTGLMYQGVFHGFEGTSSQAAFVKTLGMYIGVGGPVTFRNAQDRHDLIKELGIEDLVLETDAPLISPYPFRGQINEPARLPIIAQKVADLLELSIEEVAQKTSKNAQLLFRLD